MCRLAPHAAHIEENRLKTLLSADQLSQGVAELGNKINSHYGTAPLTVVGVMTGALVLMADLIRQLQMPVRIGLVQASSYRHQTEPGELTYSDSMLLDVADRHVLVIDDIFDTGQTLIEVLRQLRELGPSSLRSAVLLRKEHARVRGDQQPDFVAFEIPDEFVVGYGLDYRDLYRNLPSLMALEPEDLSSPSDA